MDSNDDEKLNKPCSTPKRKSWFTTRKVLTYVCIILATVSLWGGKLTGETWVLAMAVFIAGHHAADLIQAWRGR
jgi:hypothetical protein